MLNGDSVLASVKCTKNTLIATILDKMVAGGWTMARDASNAYGYFLTSTGESGNMALSFGVRKTMTDVDGTPMGWNDFMTGTANNSFNIIWNAISHTGAAFTYNPYYPSATLGRGRVSIGRNFSDSGPSSPAGYLQNMPLKLWYNVNKNRGIFVIEGLGPILISGCAFIIGVSNDLGYTALGANAMAFWSSAPFDCVTENWYYGIYPDCSGVITRKWVNVDFKPTNMSKTMGTRENFLIPLTMADSLDKIGVFNRIDSLYAISSYNFSVPNNVYYVDEGLSTGATFTINGEVYRVVRTQASKKDYDTNDTQYNYTSYNPMPSSAAFVAFRVS